MIGFNTNVFETNILNLRVVVGIVTVGLVDVLRDTLNQRRLTIRNTKLEVLEKTYQLQLELESFWIVERYVIEECDFIRRSVKREIDAEKHRQIIDEKTQKDLYQKRCYETLLNKVDQIERSIKQKALTSAISLAEKTLKEELQIVPTQYIQNLKRIENQENLIIRLFAAHRFDYSRPRCLQEYLYKKQIKNHLLAKTENTKRTRNRNSRLRQNL